MTVLMKCLVVLIGFSGGIMVAAGLFTLTTSLGIMTRLAQISHTAGYIHKYEMAVAAGAVVGNWVWMYHPGLLLGVVGLVIFGSLAGIYVGCLIGAIAEILNAFPVFLRRMKIHEKIGWLILALAAGKVAGVWIQFLK
jgi:stage V sporulation protein AB